MQNKRIPARRVAEMIGIETATLAKWRRFGKGPKDWKRVSPSLVTYGIESVERFLAERVGGSSS